MTAIEATNRGVADMPWAMLTSSPRGRRGRASTPSTRRRLTRLLLDVREPEEFARGHVPGAVNLPQADLATRLDEIPRDRPILTICQSGMRSLRSAQFLRQQGYQNVATVVGGTARGAHEGARSRRPRLTADPLRITDSEWAHAGAMTTNTTELGYRRAFTASTPTEAMTDQSPRSARECRRGGRVLPPPASSPPSSHRRASMADTLGSRVPPPGFPRKDDFAIPAGLTYINGAYTHPMPLVSAAAMRKYADARSSFQTDDATSGTLSAERESGVRVAHQREAVGDRLRPEHEHRREPRRQRARDRRTGEARGSTS